MNYLFIFLLALHVLITSTVSIAMGLEIPQNKNCKTTHLNKLNTLTEITNITKPLDAHFLNNNDIIVTGENGCSVIDSRDNKAIKKISYAKNPCLAVHPHQTLFALGDSNNINIYNAKTYALTYSILVDRPSENEPNNYNIVTTITFSPHDTSIISTQDCYTLLNDNTRYLNAYIVEQCDYITHNYIQITYRGNESSPIISCNPMENEISLVYLIDISFHNSKISDTPTKGNHTGSHIQKFHQYTPDGKLFVMGNHNTVKISNDEYKKGLTSFESLPKLPLKNTTDHYKYLKSILFCSNSILATLITMHPKGVNKDGATQGPSHSLLCYFDIHTKEIIHTDELPGVAHSFSFNPCKTKVCITLTDKVIIIPVSFGAIYKDITEKTLLYLLHGLKNINLKHKPIEIPNDIILYIASTIHETYKKD